MVIQPLEETYDSIDAALKYALDGFPGTLEKVRDSIPCRGCSTFDTSPHPGKERADIAPCGFEPVPRIHGRRSYPGPCISPCLLKPVEGDNHPAYEQQNTHNHRHDSDPEHDKWYQDEEQRHPKQDSNAFQGNHGLIAKVQRGNDASNPPDEGRYSPYYGHYSRRHERDNLADGFYDPLQRIGFRKPISKLDDEWHNGRLKFRHIGKQLETNRDKQPLQGGLASFPLQICIPLCYVPA